MAKSSFGFGDNVKGTLDGTTLTLEIDLTKTSGLSASGKNMKVASTGGNQTVPGTAIKVGLNVYKPATAK